ncbi:helix-turn-helix transcriptional regulator [uncultured Roseibium sp.]|uniref:helix-turn-helix transcriptional regulator n=1 Tax=uncultured Roseibium sp. TaxID=1936171 RepID=UPI00260ABD6D|nr:helix-turn-helix transcriptional regulator [uncultured Roseibium sp.]
MPAQRFIRTREDLSNFLIYHRAKLSPARVGLPTTERRRTPGLRREEVAQLAGVGLTWYTWFEQGRDIKVSESFLLNIAKALRLDDADCSRLFLLAHGRPPPPEAYQWVTVSPAIQQLLDDLVTRPAYVLNMRWDVIAWNQAANRLFGFSRFEANFRNLMRLVFVDSGMRERMPDWKQEAPKLLAQFRSDLVVAPDDPSIISLIEDLKALSPDFRRGMEQAMLAGYSRAISAVLDDQGNRLDFTHEALLVDEHRHLRMIVCFQKLKAEGQSDQLL